MRRHNDNNVKITIRKKLKIQLIINGHTFVGGVATIFLVQSKNGLLNKPSKLSQNDVEKNFFFYLCYISSVIVMVIVNYKF